MKKVYSIQYLRALAAGAVVIDHCAMQTVPHGGAGLFRVAEIGGAGVDIFFVISGVVMWMVTYNQPQSPIEFLRNRLIRIVPIYWLLTLAKAALSMAAPGMGDHPQMTWSHIILSMLFIPHRNPTGGQVLPVLTPGWTLNYEMFFYLVFAAVLLLPKAWRLKTLAAIMIGLSVIGLIIRTRDPALYVYTDVLLLEFVAGLFVGAWFTSDRKPSFTYGVSAIFGSLALFLLSGILEPPLHRVVQWGIPAVLMVSGVIAIETSRGMIKSKLLTMLGDGSYSTYLVHGFFAIALAMVLDRLPPQPLWVLIAGIVVCLVLANAVAMVFFKLVEMPTNKFLRGLFSPRRNAGPFVGESARS